jgi:transcription elongation factor Elf1
MPEEKIQLPFTCPVCARKTEHLFEALVEGASLTCPFCRLTLTLHGHMLEEVQREIQKLKKKT